VAAAAVLAGGCSSGSPSTGGSRSGGIGTLPVSPPTAATVVSSVRLSQSGPTWQSSGVRFTLPAGWSIVTGADVANDPAALEGMRSMSEHLGLDPGALATSLSGYAQVGFGPDEGLLLVAQVPQSDLDATTEASVRAYLRAVCARQPRLCEELVGFATRHTGQGDAVVTVTRSVDGTVSGSIGLPYVARAGAGSSTRQGRRISVVASDQGSVEAVVNVILATIRQS